MAENASLKKRRTVDPSMFPAVKKSKTLDMADGFPMPSTSSSPTAVELAALQAGQQKQLQKVVDAMNATAKQQAELQFKGQLLDAAKQQLLCNKRIADLENQVAAAEKKSRKVVQHHTTIKQLLEKCDSESG